MDTISPALWKEYNDVLSHSDEKEARDFLVEHLDEFPQDVKDAIISAFFEEALTRKAGDLQTIKSFQKDALKEVTSLEQGKKKLADKEKLLEIKKSL